MKYIKAMDGKVLSVSQLLLPAKGRDENDDPIWRLNLISVDGMRRLYASYDSEELAEAVYVYALGFIENGDHRLLLFGENGMPRLLYVFDLREFVWPVPAPRPFEEDDSDSVRDTDESG